MHTTRTLYYSRITRVGVSILARNNIIQFTSSYAYQISMCILEYYSEYNVIYYELVNSYERVDAY